MFFRVVQRQGNGEGKSNGTSTSNSTKVCALPQSSYHHIDRHAAQRASMSNIPEDPHDQTSPISRKRADSHQPACYTSRSRRSDDASHTEHIHSAAHTRSSSHDYEQTRRYSGADYGYVGTRLSPQLPPSNPQGEIRRLSGNFNAPTHVELARNREHRKGLNGVEKLRSKVRGWVKA